MKLSDWKPLDIIRLFVILVVTGMFSFALIREQDQNTRSLLIGALITAFTAAVVQFPFGTSSGSTKKDDTIAQMAENQDTALKTTPPPPPYRGTNP